jgi:uncharacterized protein with PQ loop repeat
MTRETWSLLIGWASTAILMATLWGQIYREYRLGKADEISPVLFIGQCVASLGFLTYSALVGSVVFVVSNALILLTAFAGELMRRHLMRRQLAKQKK